jgi:hypothetical protein
MRLLKPTLTVQFRNVPHGFKIVVTHFDAFHRFDEVPAGKYESIVTRDNSRRTKDNRISVNVAVIGQFPLRAEYRYESGEKKHENRRTTAVVCQELQAIDSALLPFCKFN